MKRFWVYFVGTHNGAWVEAPDMSTAKERFAAAQGVRLSCYIKASRKAPDDARQVEVAT